MPYPINFAVPAPRMDNAIFTRLWSEFDDLPLVFTLDMLDWGRLPAVRIRFFQAEDGIRDKAT